MQLSITALRLLREVAQHGSISAAAAAVSLSQSAVSRQIAGLEHVVGRSLFERRRDGIRVTDAGHVLLRHAAVILEAVEAAELDLSEAGARPAVVRLGAFPSASATLVPIAAAQVRGRGIELVTRVGTTPSLLRALRSGTLDLAVVASAPPFRPLDDVRPAFITRTLSEDELRVAAPIHHPLAAQSEVDVEALEGQRWIASRSKPGEQMLGAWPGLAGRARIVHTTPDWLAKLQLVARGEGFTTVPNLICSLLPDGVVALRVRGGPSERRRALVARLPSARGAAIEGVEAALADAALELSASAARRSR